MKDGFDRSVAEKMPRIQKKRPNRPWNVDPVLLNSNAQEEEQEKVRKTPRAQSEKPQEAHVSRAEVASRVEKAVEETLDAVLQAAEIVEEVPVQTAAIIQEPEAVVDVLPKAAVPEQKNENVAKAVETIKELNSDFTKMIFDRKSIQKQLEKSASTMEEVAQENAKLKESLSLLESNAVENTLLEREIDFLNEQLEDADLYIQNMVGLLEEKAESFEQETGKRKDLETRFEKINKEIQDKAKLDVKVSILERDLSISNTRILELESKLEEEYQRREPLELEIVELKNALDRVYSSLAHIRLKAKREVYGS